MTPRGDAATPTLFANDPAAPGRGIGKLIGAALVARMIAGCIGLDPESLQQMIAGTLAVDLVPRGTLTECIRAGGYGS